jgi:SAM-dependent methyltransferase
MPANPTAGTAPHYATIWQNYWQTTESDDEPPLWDVPIDPANLAALMDSALPIVDLGCGNGVQTDLLAEHFRTVIGADVSPAAIALAQRTHPHPRVTYLVLDVFDREALRELHERLDDANVYLKGVLHQIAPDLRPAFVDGLQILLGDRGTLHLLELGPAAEAYLEEISAEHGPPPELAKVIESGIRPGGVTPDEVMTLLGHDYEPIVGGDDYMPTTLALPDGRPARVPAIQLTARRAQPSR